MSNDLANNAELVSTITKHRYLEVDKSGYPLNKQVPRTVQVYEGTGGEQIIYDGSSDILIKADDLVGDLEIILGPEIQNIRNLVNRCLSIQICGRTGNTINVDSQPVSMRINGTTAVESYHKIIGDNNSKTVTLYFSEEEYINLDYGAAVGTIIPSGAGGIQTITNIGAGQTIATNNSPTNVDLKSIVGGNNIRTSNDATTITVLSIVPTAAPVSIFYDYMNPITVNFTGSYQTPDILNASIVEPPAFDEGTVTILTSVTFTFTPAPRLTRSVLIVVRLTFNSGTFTTLVIKLQPRLTFSTDTNMDLSLATTTTDGALYQYDLQAFSLKPMINYDLTPVVLPGICTCIAMNVADNILYFVLAASINVVRYYDFVTKAVGIVIPDITVVGQWTIGSVIAAMCFDQKDNVLYVIGNNINSRIEAFNTIPFNRALGVPLLGAACNYASPVPNVVGTVHQDIDIDSGSKMFICTVFVSAANVTQARQLGGLSGPPTNNALVSLSPNTDAHIFFGASGRIYTKGETNKQMRRFNSGINGGGPGSVVIFTDTADLTDITGRSPYGILA